MQDARKLTLKDDLEEQLKNLEEYDKHDLEDYPGWTFLVAAVVKAYDICPFLNVYDDEARRRRVPWLQSQFDKGAIYDREIDELTNPNVVRDIESQIHNTKVDLSEYVQGVLSRLELPDGIDHDTLIENIRMRKEAKSQNKKVKDAWSTSLRILEFIMQEKGIDFSKYIQVVYGYPIRYKAPAVPESVLDKTFYSYYDGYLNLKAKLAHVHYIREKEIAAAKEHLSNLINQNFQVNQVGKYFKKWSTLTQEKKEERIKSYCDWFMRKQNRPVSDADAMRDFILLKLASKELRGMDVEWNNKIGMITNINIFMDEDGEFELGKRAPKVLKKRNGRKKKDELFQTDDEKELLERINRLLLFEILKGNSINKELVVKSVISNVHTRKIPESNLREYIVTKYDKMVETVRRHPLHSHF